MTEENKAPATTGASTSNTGKPADKAATEGSGGKPLDVTVEGKQRSISEDTPGGPGRKSSRVPANPDGDDVAIDSKYAEPKGTKHTDQYVTAFPNETTRKS